MPQVCFLSLGLGEGGVVPPLAWVWGRRGDQLIEGRRGGEDWKVDGCLLVLGEHPKIMGACPHLVGGLVISSFSSCS
jgi:hypothetical protein